MNAANGVKFGYLILVFFLVFSGGHPAAAFEPASYARLSPGKVALLSLIPGEGQFYNHRVKKGWLFLGVEVTAITAVALTAQAEQNAWRAYRLSDTKGVEAFHLFQYRQQQLNKRNLIYLLLFIKTAAALDAYVDAHFFAIDHRSPQVGVGLTEEKVNIRASITW